VRSSSQAQSEKKIEQATENLNITCGVGLFFTLLGALRERHGERERNAHQGPEILLRGEGEEDGGRFESIPALETRELLEAHTVARSHRQSSFASQAMAFSQLSLNFSLFLFRAL